MRSVFEVESVNAVTEIPFKEEIMSGVAHELSEKVETVSAVGYEDAFEVESINEVTEITFKEEIMSGVAHELSEEVTTVSAFSHEFSSEVETVDIPFEEELTLRIAHELSTETKTVSSFGHEYSVEVVSANMILLLSIILTHFLFLLVKLFSISLFVCSHKDINCMQIVKRKLSPIY